MLLPPVYPGAFRSGRGVFLRCGSLPNRPQGVFAGGECVSSNRCGPLVCRVCAVCEPVGRKIVRANLVFAPLSARGIGRTRGSPVRANLVFAPLSARGFGRTRGSPVRCNPGDRPWSRFRAIKKPPFRGAKSTKRGDIQFSTIVRSIKDTIGR